MIPFNIPPQTGEELRHIGDAIAAHKICGDGAYTKKCQAWMKERFHAKKVLLTTSGDYQNYYAAMYGVNNSCQQNSLKTNFAKRG